MVYYVTNHVRPLTDASASVLLSPPIPWSSCIIPLVHSLAPPLCVVRLSPKMTWSDSNAPKGDRFGRCWPENNCGQTPTPQRICRSTPRPRICSIHLAQTVVPLQHTRDPFRVTASLPSRSVDAVLRAQKLAVMLPKTTWYTGNCDDTQWRNALAICPGSDGRHSMQVQILTWMLFEFSGRDLATLPFFLPC